ncbi:MAG TPA: APC family permease [Galbitalea sp.]|nr:APC family permease [Galbitalea sp.]
MSKTDSTTPTSAGTAPTLRRNSVGLAGTVIMSAAIMGPAVSTFFNPQFSTPFSGFATPFVYLATLIVTLIVANGVMEMARVAPSAGSFYTYITRALGPRAGFATGGLMFVAYALLGPIEIGLIGAYLQETLKQQFGVDIPWIWIGLVPWILMVILAFEGIRSSIRVATILFCAEVVVVVAISIIVIANNPHHITAASLSPTTSSHGVGGLVTGFVFAALSFVGFEGATALGDEAKRPSRTIPLGILFSTLLVGLIYLLGTWALSVGLGQAGMNKLVGSDTPWNTFVSQYAPWLQWFLIIAAISSMFAVMINSNNGIVRIVNTMGREGLLPKALGRIDEKRRTPTIAVIWEGLFVIVAAVIVGLFSGGLTNPLGGNNVYGYLGFVLTLAILPVYVLVNWAVIVYFRKRPDFNWFRHIVLPVLGGLLMIGLLVGQIYYNQAPPFSWMPYAVLGWLILVIVVAIVLGRTRPDALKRAGAIMATGELLEETAAHGAPEEG